MVEPAEAKRKLVPDEERKSLSQLYEDQFLQVGKKIMLKHVLHLYVRMVKI